MATYYVRTDGNDSNAGTGPATNQAWQTIGKALGATGIGSGDTLYVAPGDYRQTANITVGGTYTAPTNVIGDPTSSQFSGIPTGRVLITNRLSSDLGNTAGTFALFTMLNKNFLRFSNLVFEQTASAHIFSTGDCTELRWNKCWFQHNSGSAFSCIVSTDTPSLGLLKNYYITQCVATGWNSSGALYADSTLGRSTGSNWIYNLYINRCVLLSCDSISLLNNSNLIYSATGFYISNCTGITINAQNLRSNLEVINCIGYEGTAWVIGGLLGPGGTGLISNCSIYGTTGFTGYTTTNLRTAKYQPFNVGMERLWGLPQKDWFSADGLYSYATGTVTNAPVVDIYDVAWAGGAPNVGSYNNYTTTLAGQYNPTERNASTITIAPGSTSQSIELYLGATGLTFSTSGLAAYYVRNQSAPVAITLVTQTPTGAWTSGGFAEIDSSLVPGVYRLDVPNAAFAAGASDVTIVVRGASGTNGAVLTVTLSSGGLTAAQTAAAVWDEPYTAHTTASTFGARTLKTTVDNRNVDVGTSFHIQSNVHAIVDSTAAADELRGALLHNGTDYISAELVTPVTSAALVRMGPFEVRADGLGASDPLDIQTGAQHGIDIQCVDNNGSGIDITSATVTAKVYNSGATLVDTYSCTATYAADGRAQFTIDTTVTNTPGTYTATITRTTGASDTQIFGPLRIYVRDI
jgi:hypothetical protein